MSIVILNRCFYPIISGKPDPKNPGSRKLQKAAANQRCMHYALRIITPRRGDPDYPHDKRLKDRCLSNFSKNPIAQSLEDKAILLLGEFFKAEGMHVLDILKPFILRNLKLTSDPKVASIISAYPNDEEAQIKAFLRCMEDVSEIFVVIARAQILKMYREVFNLRVSSFQNLEELTDEETIKSLISALKKDGPMYVQGFFGKSYYSTQAKKVNDPLFSDPLLKTSSLFKSCFGWTQPRTEQEEEYAHAVVICGAASFHDGLKVHHRVYFIDPNDASDPTQETHRKVYTMSIKTFRKYLTPFDRVELPFTEENFKPGYGIQRKMRREEDPFELDCKENDSYQLSPSSSSSSSLTLQSRVSDKIIEKYRQQIGSDAGIS